jgi:hypothetical protein
MRKALVVVVAVAGQAVTLGLLHGTAQNVALLLITGAAAVGVYAVPNTPKAA